MDAFEFVALDMRSTVNLATKFPKMADSVADDRLCQYASMAMKEKLEEKRAEGRGGWWDDSRCSIEVLRKMLAEHVEKGDMVDVMNLSAMIYARECKDTILV